MRRALFLLVIAGCAQSGDPLFGKIHVDAGAIDAPVVPPPDAEVDAGPPDATPSDAGPIDAKPPDARPIDAQ
ncbi:MAG TPA: hypothetical protein VL463_21730 [Kofleriaceae bacterium]|nr:hypothetical protein [Kofleriaceae bacterium]